MKHTNDDWIMKRWPIVLIWLVGLVFWIVVILVAGHFIIKFW